MNRTEESTDDDYKYLMDCETNTQMCKSDVIRSKYFQLNALQNTFNNDVFNKLRLNLMNDLSKEIDRNDGKNTYLSAAKHLAQLSSRDNKQNEWNSRLITLSEQQLLNKFKIKRKNIHEIQNKEKAFVLKTEFNENDNKCDANDVEMSDICVVKTTNVPKSNLFSKVGLFSQLNQNCASNQSNSSPKRKTFFSQNSSPTRVSGIFKKNNSPVNIKADVSVLKRGHNSNDNQMESSSRPFMTGLEKKLVNDVKKKSLTIDEAKKVLNQQKNVRRQPFKNPLKSENDEDFEKSKPENELLSDERLKNIDPHMIEVIENEIISNLEPIEWSKIAGLEFAKSRIYEIAILPLKRPELFGGIRVPPKGILLFGPPGTGKTLIGRCIASLTNSTFFSITVSSLTSKWIGEGEKMIRAMFAVARCKQPAVIFIDEIDSLLKTRCDSEHESSRRMKTEFLAQFEGVSTDRNERLLIIGATNRPQELDDAARRRLSSRLYIPLPDREARKQIINDSMSGESHTLTDEQINDLAVKTEGYSGADMRQLCSESAMVSFREALVMEKINEITKNEIRGISYEDFLSGLNVVKPSVSSDDLLVFEDWNRKYGTNLGHT